MGFIVVVLKILLMLASVFVMLLPLLLEYISFKRDEAKGISHKRFRLLVFSVVYCAVITVVIVFMQELIQWIGSWSWVAWLASKTSVPDRTAYGVEVYAVMVLNLIIGLVFKLLLMLVRIGLKKKNLLEPKEDGEFSWAQKAERKVLKFFDKEQWFFAGLILKYLCLSLVAVYALVFLFYLLPVLFGADWVPYAFATRLFEAGYIYPLLTLLPLFEAWLFLAGVENIQEECPELEKEETQETTSTETELKTINEECKTLFKDYFARELPATDMPLPVASTAFHRITKLIAKSVEVNSRHPKPIREGYLQCLDTIVRNDIGSEKDTDGGEPRGILINGSFFTDFSEYFMRYIGVILARGDNVLFVCNDNSQIEQTYECVKRTLEQIYSLHHTEADRKDISFDSPVWNVTKVDSTTGENVIAAVNNCSALVTDLNFLTSTGFEQQCDTFIHLVDTVVLVDALGTVNKFSRQMSIFDATVKNIRERNAIRAKNGGRKKNSRAVVARFQVRYSCNPIKYICFGDSRIPGLDRVLTNLLSLDLAAADAMHYNNQTIISCYNFEGRPGEDGQYSRIQLANAGEDLGVLINMANHAALLGAGKISVFAQEQLPFRDLEESTAANKNHGLQIQKGNNLFMNSFQYELDDCRVIVAFDHEDNLPMAVRRFRTLTTEKPTLVMLFSRPYLFRDYYLANINECWKSEQMMRIPMERAGKYNAIRKILVKANSGGIATREIMDILTDARLEDYADLLESENIRGILVKLLMDCGKHQTDAERWNDYFEFVKFSDFDTHGTFVTEEQLCLRNKRVLGSLLDNTSPVKAVFNGKEFALPIPKNRITQNFILGQNMLYDGCVYVITDMDVAKGKLFVQRATGGLNTEAYRYVQDREYHIDFSDPNPERVYATKQVELDRGEEIKVTGAKISVTRRPMEVVTKGYSEVQPQTLAENNTASAFYYNITSDDQLDKFKQTYRKYGEVKNPVCSHEMMMRSKVSYGRYPDGALVMSVKLTGEFGENPARMQLLASVMLNELLKTMFPAAADAVVACPVVDPAVYEDEEARKILQKLPKVYCREYDSDSKDMELLIIEDCAADLGVISVLMESGDNVLKLLFNPIYKYLQWHMNNETPSKYLYFGKEEAPACFDFEGLSKLATALGKEDFVTKFVDVESVMLCDVCDFCGKRYPKGTDVTVLEDGRKMCKDCASSLVANDKKVLKAHLERAKIYLESTYGITLGDDYEFCFESTVKIVNTLKKSPVLLDRGADVPMKSYIDDKKRVHVEYSIPSANLSELLVRELTHVWQLKHLPQLEAALAEGHMALVGIQYLRFLNQSALASVRTTYYESTGNPSGEGYRKLVKELLENPQYNNNPFLYLLEKSGVVTDDRILPPAPRVIEDGNYGLPYTPEKPDRSEGMPPYFHYARLTSTCQKAYELMLEAIRNHEESVTVFGCSGSDLRKISDAVAFDHPELFWYNDFAVSGTKLILKYGATAEECAVLQKRIDEVVAKYLEGIEPTMSAYDVALRLHVKLINSVDYDTIALNREKQQNGPADDKIDYLRSICGVFLEGKAVCEGYARAMQYMLQKCGVECAEMAGDIVKEDGEPGGGHAWNILKVDGDYYYLDTTWDDSSNTIQSVKNTNLGFDYFCITTEELLRTRDLKHTPTDAPICVATRANYYYHNDAMLESYDLDKLKTIAQTAAKSGQKFFTFKCKTKALYEEALQKVCVEGTDCFEVLRAAAKADKKIETAYRYSYDKNLWTITVYFKYK